MNFRGNEKREKIVQGMRGFEIGKFSFHWKQKLDRERKTLLEHFVSRMFDYRWINLVIRNSRPQVIIKLYNVLRVVCYADMLTEIDISRVRVRGTLISLGFDVLAR